MALRKVAVSVLLGIAGLGLALGPASPASAKSTTASAKPGAGKACSTPAKTVLASGKKILRCQGGKWRAVDPMIAVCINAQDDTEALLPLSYSVSHTKYKALRAAGKHLLSAVKADDPYRTIGAYQELRHSCGKRNIVLPSVEQLLSDS